MAKPKCTLVKLQFTYVFNVTINRQRKNYLIQINNLHLAGVGKKGHRLISSTQATTESSRKTIFYFCTKLYRTLIVQFNYFNFSVKSLV